MDSLNQAPIKAVAYARVSTLMDQNPELQMISIRQFAEARRFQLVDQYVDKGISGAKERPALDALINDARRGKFKILIVTGIDRIGRNTRHLLNLIHELSGYGVGLISIRENLDFTTAVGQATLTILGAVSQLERELTKERIRTSLAAKKLADQQTGSGWRCGRPNLIDDNVIGRVRTLRAEGKSIRGIELALNKAVSKTTVARILSGEF